MGLPQGALGIEHGAKRREGRPQRLRLRHGGRTVIRLTRSVVVTDHPWPAIEPEQQVLARAGAKLTLAPAATESQLIECVVEADAILTCFARVTAPILEAAPRLTVVGRYGIGVDNIDVEAATRLGILVTNVPSYCEDEVAEHALGLILALARGLVDFDRGIRMDDWSLTQVVPPLRRIRGRTLGIVGVGRIGRLLARKAQGLGLDVIGCRSNDAEAGSDSDAVEIVSLRDIARRADFVSLHVPLRPDTRHLIDERFLRAMKPSAFLINTARGEVIDQRALVAALRENWIAGAGLDVLDTERVAREDPLLAQRNVIVTPHVAYYSEESLLELGRLAAENVASVLTGHVPASVVNSEVLALDRWRKLRRGRGT